MGCGLAPRVLALLTRRLAPPELCGPCGQRGAVAGIGDVPGDRVRVGQSLDRLGQPGGVAGVEDQRPPVPVQLAGQRVPSPWEAPVITATFSDCW